MEKPEITSVPLFTELLASRDTATLATLYRLLPCVKRPELAEKPAEIFRSTTSTSLARAVALGIGECSAKAHLPLLLESFKDAKPEVREGLAEALGRLRELEALPLFAGYLEDKRNWYTTPLVTEAVLIALGRLQKADVEKLLQPLFDDLPIATLFTVRLTTDHQRDRLAGSLAWLMGDLDPQFSNFAVQKDFLTRVFATRAPRASIMAAKTLSQRSSEEAQKYLTDLINNPAVEPSLRLLSGKALANSLGEKSLNFLPTRGAEVPQIQLLVCREIRGKIPNAFALTLIASTDYALSAEGALALALNGGAAELAEVMARAKATTHPLARAFLYYAWEEIASR